MKSAFFNQRFWLIVLAFTVVLLALYAMFRFAYNPALDASYGNLFESQSTMSGRTPAKTNEKPRYGATEKQTREYQGTSEDSIKKVKGDRYATY